MNFFTKLLRMVLAVAAAVCWFGCGGGDSGANSGGGGNVYRGGDITGDWLMYSIKYSGMMNDTTLVLDEHNKYRATVESYTSSGEYFARLFEKSMTGVWSETVSYLGCTYRTEGSTLYVEDSLGKTKFGWPYQYNVSNNILTASGGSVLGDNVVTCTKIDLDEFRRSLGL